MLLELKELSKRVKDKQEKEKDSSNKKEKESQLNSKLLDKDNFPKNNLVLLNRLELKERITWIRFKSKSKLKQWKKELKKKRRRLFKTIKRKFKLKSQPTNLWKSKIDLTTSKKAKRLEMQFSLTETRFKIYRLLNYQS